MSEVLQHANMFCRYRGIISRCYYAKEGTRAWRNYRGRGIRMCDRWLHGEGGLTGYECFVADMGLPPERMDLDRKDNDGNYEPSNCRWLTRSENLKNRRPEFSLCRMGHPPSVGRSSSGNCLLCKSAYDRRRYAAKKGAGCAQPA